jgi:putative glycosyltransferase (TIGR04372 family)
MARDFLRYFRHRLLVCRPDGVYYGHLGMELVTAFARARDEGSALAILHPRPLVNPAYVALVSDEVPVVTPGWSLRVRLSLWWLAGDVRRWLGETVSRLRLDAVRAIRNRLRARAAQARARGAVPPYLRDATRRFSAYYDRLNERDRRGPPYLLRRTIERPVPVRLPEPLHRRVEAAARDLGIRPRERLVTIHAREAGFKRGQERHDRERKRLRDESARNVDIATFFPAVDCLVERGYTIVRIGDPSMVPVERPGVIDLATSRHRTPELEAYCLLNSAFMLGVESGPTVVTYLTNTPTLTVNATDPISSFPIRRDGMYMLKRVRNRATGEMLTLRDMLTARYLLHLRDTTRFEYVSNAPAEILAAVDEMLQLLAGHAVESERQLEYRQLATSVAEALKSESHYIRKWGTDAGFLGSGRIVRTFVEQYL